MAVGLFHLILSKFFCVSILHKLSLLFRCSLSGNDPYATSEFFFFANVLNNYAKALLVKPYNAYNVSFHLKYHLDCQFRDDKRVIIRAVDRHWKKFWTDFGDFSVIEIDWINIF